MRLRSRRRGGARKCPPCRILSALLRPPPNMEGRFRRWAGDGVRRGLGADEGGGRHPPGSEGGRVPPVSSLPLLRATRTAATQTVATRMLRVIQRHVTPSLTWHTPP
eukprot:3772858-Prymnesium_polylepis.1